MSFGFLVSVVRRTGTGVVASMLLAALGFLGLSSKSVSVSGLGFVASGCLLFGVRVGAVATGLLASMVHIGCRFSCSL